MGIFGCLPILFILLVIIAISLLGKSIEMLGATAVWIWESVLNIFRPMKKEVRNPWTGVSNFDREDEELAEKQERQKQSFEAPQRNEDGTMPKMYDKDDGDYIDFTEVK